MLILLFMILGLILISAISSYLVLYRDFSHYKRVYEQLPNMKFYRNQDHIYGYMKNTTPNSSNGDFVWFLEKNAFRLGHLTTDHYIHNAFFSYFSPYTMYWYFKYKKWCKENINLDAVEEFKYV